MSRQDDEGGAAAEAAQHVVDQVTSYEYSADDDTIERKLDEGFREAEVAVGDDEKRRLVGEIHDVRNDEDGGTPQVENATPSA